MRIWPGFAALALIGVIVWWAMPQAQHDAVVQTTTPNNATHWQNAPRLNIARRSFAMASNERYVYAVGGIGNDGTYIGATEYAEALTNGELGPWRVTSSLQEPRFYLGSVVMDNWIYALGGAIGPLGDDNLPVATVERAPVLDDGSLGQWELVTPMNTPRRGLQTVVVGKSIYALGGYNGAFLRDAEFAAVQDDGTLSTWQHHTSEMSAQRYMHAAAANRHAVFLVAGHIEGAGNGAGDVEIAEIALNGPLHPWTTNYAVLRTGRFLASAVANDDTLVIIGGHDGTRQLPSVEVATLLGGRSPKAWRAGPSLHTPRSAAAAVVVNDLAVVAGGAAGDHILDTVETIPMEALRAKP